MFRNPLMPHRHHNPHHQKSPKTCEFFWIKLCCNRSHITYFVIFGSIFFGISEKQKVKGPFKRQWHQSSGKIPVWRCQYFAFKLQCHTSENFTFPDKNFKSMIISVNYYFMTFLSVLICIHIHPGKSSGKRQRVFKQTLGLQSREKTWCWKCKHFILHSVATD